MAVSPAHKLLPQQFNAILGADPDFSAPSDKTPYVDLVLYPEVIQVDRQTGKKSVVKGHGIKYYGRIFGPHVTKNMHASNFYKGQAVSVVAEPEVTVSQQGVQMVRMIVKQIGPRIEFAPIYDGSERAPIPEAYKNQAPPAQEAPAPQEPSNPFDGDFAPPEEPVF